MIHFFESIEEQVRFFQFYLVGLLISVLPLAALLSRHQNDLQRIETSHRMLQAAERAAKVGHWRYALADRSFYWSAEALRIAGFPPGAQPELTDVLGIYHPEDQQRVRGLTVLALRNGLPFTYEARILREDGSLCHVESRGEVEQDESGKVRAIFGTLMDITERREKP